MLHIIVNRPAEITFGKAEIMDGIEQIGLARAVLSANPVNTGIELKNLFPVIFELEQGNAPDMKHTAI